MGVHTILLVLSRQLDPLRRTRGGSGVLPLPCAPASPVQIPCHRQCLRDGQAAVTTWCPIAARVPPCHGAAGVPGAPADPGRLSDG